MSEQDNKQVVRRVVDDIDSGGNLDLADELFAEEYVNHNPSGEIQGPEGYKELISTFHDAFPDLDFTIEDLLATDDKVINRFTAHGTHEGEFMGIEPTGNEMEMPIIAIHQLNGGKLLETWVVFDELGLLQQLGVDVLE